jgi:SAM-dependent methyltransferase
MAEIQGNDTRTGLDETPRSLIDGGPTRPWCHLPGDYQRPDSPETFDLYWDEVNGFGMVHPRAKDAWETLPYYEMGHRNYYTHVDPREAEGGSHSSMNQERGATPWFARLLVRLAWSQDWGVPVSSDEVDRCCPRRPAAILDLGCGPGDMLARCRELGHTVVGVEPDPKPRATALARGLDVYSGTAEDLPEPIRGQTFDVILALHVIHHCIDPVAALGNLAGRLAPGGRLICEVPNHECLGARWAGLAWGHLDVPRQANVFTLRSLSRLIERSALRVEQVCWAQYCRQFHLRNIESERQKFEFLEARGSDRACLPVRPSLLSRYGLLAASLFARPHHKYDCLRIIARKEHDDCSPHAAEKKTPDV